MLVGKPILAGDSDAHQLEIIFDLCGTPTLETMPGWRDLPGAREMHPRERAGDLGHRFRNYGSAAVSLLKELLKLDWKKRINAIDALQHPYFRTPPLPALPGDIPTFEESHELDRRKFHDRKAALPPAPKGGTVGGGANNNTGFSGGDGYRNGVNGSRYPRNRPPPAGQPDERQPAWHRERGLPPRPPPPVEYGNGWDPPEHGDAYRDRDGGRPPRSRGAPANRSDIDTYIPSYDRDAARREGREVRDDRRRRDDWDDRRHEWERRRGPPEYDDRARASRTRSRSRSPIRDRDRERERYYMDRK